ncbi:MAG: AraC family transcriptional regulator [Aquabacterium sp.]|nr:AraC family transcriptional regulator [Aquabacterium sp.]
MTEINNQSIVKALLALTPQAGCFSTAIQGVTLMRADQSTPPAPVLQEPTIVVLGQGVKRGYVGDQIMTYQSGQCLAVAIPMHFSCDTIVEVGNPMLALAVAVDRGIVSELMSKMDLPRSAAPETFSRGMVVDDLSEATLETVVRLLQALASPEDAKILGPQLIRELHYRMLSSPSGEILCSVVAWQGKLGAIYRVCQRIQLDYAQGDLDVASLASEAAMSTSAFHQAFKDVTGCSPIQYIKATRLQRAHELIQGSNHAVAQAAYEVGYASASQFSREFRRMFGYSPGDAIHH